MHRDRDLIGRAPAETLRYTPPVHVIMRQTSAVAEIAGGLVPAGATVICLIGAATSATTPTPAPSTSARTVHPPHPLTGMRAVSRRRAPW
ncbi:hypothetical protein GCM10022419_091600 [Nonomuraea rosea]|uniref:Uncharacterized protein n=1 Tax=Nonomuraea rosea TaxID=638574 RepID=A0ABP6Z0U0_9ACTN